MSLIGHYQKKLNEAIATASDLSDQASDLLRTGLTLDDPRIVTLTRQRAQAHEDIADFKEAVRQEQQAATKGEQHHMEATDDLLAFQRGGRQPSAWVAPQSAGETMTHRGNGPTPFDSFGQQLTAVVTAAQHPHQTDKRLTEIDNYALGLGETVPSEGGFLVQTDFTDELLRRIHVTGKLISRPRHIPIGERANGIKINAIDETSRVDGSRLGGVRAFWTAEAAAITKSKPTFRQVELTLHKLAGLYYATDEELQDTAALEETIASFYAEEMAFKLDDALIRGLGAGQPLGILGHAGTVSVAKEVGQAAKTIIVENVEKMFERLWARAADPVWLINQNCWRQLFALSKAVGVGGVPVFLPAGGLSGKPFQTLLGLPIIAIEHCETLGTVGDIILADFASGYVMIDKGGIQAASSIHVQFITDEMVFRFTLRTDGQPVANVPLTPYKGTEKQSSFITLDTRAA